MKISRRHAASAAIAALGLLSLAPRAQANDAASYPTKPITIVYPYASGGASDTLARQVADVISKSLGQPVIVDPKPGAGGSTALEMVTRAPADGYTLVLSASGTMAVNPHIYNLKYKPVEDLAPITILAEIPFTVVINSSFPAQNLKEFIAYAKANPGKVSFANAGIGTQAHLTQVMFMKAAGITANIVPYKGGVPASTDLLGGHVDAMIDNAAAQVANVQAGKVRALFVTTQERSASLPRVPTADEAGLPGFVTSGWFGLAAPRGTSQAIIDKLNAVIVKGMSQPEMRRKMIEAGWMPLGDSPSDATTRARGDLARFGALVQQIELKKE
ncbi:tripartite tricarboxylate transporter substrate binding protein [Variovorax sp. S2]|uniref:Bug family tripartite tricarboxylate transporter substrate binding protein n=1 Tax=Variovorax sp. S12S4 TaxID=3029170 RepID=UPI00215C10E7|nr:tripartite tricarboxylate transporter substrate binding protein [Variovorax sp. S12S4]MCR8959765.1 tripartite tricarboxylate transporter substrate binding protein [Variovorax sp. S12S4]